MYSGAANAHVKIVTGEMQADTHAGYGAGKTRPNMKTAASRRTPSNDR